MSSLCCPSLSSSPSTICMRSPIQRITGTAIELPIALYRGVSGHSSAGLPWYGTLVQSRGKPCKSSHSVGVSFLTTYLALVSLTSLGMGNHAPRHHGRHLSADLQRSCNVNVYGTSRVEVAEHDWWVLVLPCGLRRAHVLPYLRVGLPRRHREHARLYVSALIRPCTDSWTNAVVAENALGLNVPRRKHALQLLSASRCWNRIDSCPVSAIKTHFAALVRRNSY